MDDFVGFRFRPTDEEIILHFLERKMRGADFHAVKEVDILKYDPWELPNHSALQDDQVWYFFIAPSHKYAKSKRTDRTTSSRTGSWKITGKDSEVKDRCKKDVIGIRKTLVFYKGRAPNTARTNWVMHEFHSNNAHSYQNQFVFCRLKRKTDDKSDTLQDEPSSFRPFNSGNNGEQNILSQVLPFQPVNHDAQNIASQVTQELPMELDLVDCSELGQDDFFFLQSILHPDQRTSPSNGSNNGSNFLLDVSEPEDDFVNSLLADKVELYEETVHARPDGFNPTKSLRGVYVGDSSDSDTEPVQAQFGLGTPKSFLGNVISEQSLQMKRIQVPTETRNPSNHHRNGRGENGLFYDEISASIVNSKTETPKTIGVVFSASPDKTRVSKAQHLPRSYNLEEKKCAPIRLESQAKFSCISVSRDRVNEAAEHVINPPRKENSVSKFRKGQKISQTNHAKTNAKSRSTRSDGSNKKDSFNLEASPINHKQTPPLVYLGNVAIGLILTLICLWEIASLH